MISHFFTRPCLCLFVVSNYFRDHLVRQADDHLTVVGDMTLMDTDFIRTGRLSTGDLAVFDGDGIEAAQGIWNLIGSILGDVYSLYHLTEGTDLHSYSRSLVDDTVADEADGSYGKECGHEDHIPFIHVLFKRFHVKIISSLFRKIQSHNYSIKRENGNRKSKEAHGNRKTWKLMIQKKH